MIIVKGTLSVPLYSLRMSFGIKFCPTTLRPLILPTMSEIYFSVTGFKSSKFIFEFLR